MLLKDKNATCMRVDKILFSAIGSSDNEDFYIDIFFEDMENVCLRYDSAKIRNADYALLCEGVDKCQK